MDGMLPLAEINRTSIPTLNLISYLRLGEACTNFLRRLGHNRVSDGSSLHISTFLNNFKNGSKPIRNVLDQSSKKTPVRERTHIRTFLRLAELGNPDDKLIKNTQEFWAYNFLPHSLREFILKFNSNLLGLNTRVSHFVANHSRACTFCSQVRRPAPPDETFIHLFFECPQTLRYLSYFEGLIFVELANATAESKRLLWFMGVFDKDVKNNNRFLGSCIWVVKFLIWEAKLKKKLPTTLALRDDFFHMMGGIYDCSLQVRLDRTNVDSNFCRNWLQLRRA